MKRSDRRARRAGAVLGLASLACGLLLVVGLVGVLLSSPSAGRDATRADLATVSSGPGASSGQDDAQQVPAPVRIAIPAIGVSAPVLPLGLDRDGALEVPRDFAATGWWTGGARPGERGPAVIAGHVDSRTGPAVFFRLSELRRGDPVIVERADGSRVQFSVERFGSYPKARFPTAEVYGPTAAAELRLITCSGTFDRTTGHYLDNTVIYARG